MALPPKPDESLALKALPEPLRRAIGYMFSADLKDTALVGGTALAGYYACHRQSDDLDLFVASTSAHAAMVYSAKNLTTVGAAVEIEIQTPTYFRAIASLAGHRFTVDVVLDSNLHSIGQFHTTPSGITVPDLETLLMMKTAAIVRRCSEKDLYDLNWLTQHYRRPTPTSWISLGQRYEGGLTAETLLISLTGAHLRHTACGFAEAFGVTSTEVLHVIDGFRRGLQRELSEYLEAAPVKNKDVAALIRKLKKLR